MTDNTIWNDLQDQLDKLRIKVIIYDDSHDKNRANNYNDFKNEYYRLKNIMSELDEYMHL